MLIPPNIKMSPLGHITRCRGEVRGVLLILLYPKHLNLQFACCTKFSKLNRQFRQILHKGFNESSLPSHVNVSTNSALQAWLLFDFKPLCRVSLCGARGIRISTAKALRGLIYERGRGLVPGFFCNVPAIHAPDLRHFCV